MNSRATRSLPEMLPALVYCRLPRKSAKPSVCSSRTCRKPGGPPRYWWDGNDLTTDADDLAGLIEHLDLVRCVLVANRPGSSVSQGKRDEFWAQCMTVGIKGALDCIAAFSETDTTEDLKAIDVPTLILHGDHDHIVPIAAAAHKSIRLLPNATLTVYPGGPHGLSGAYEQQFNSGRALFGVAP